MDPHPSQEPPSRRNEAARSGRMTGERDQGAQVFGLDLSEGMLTEARRRNPDISFLRGTMLALGIGEASGGPTVAAIGNAVAHALGARIRDLPMTRDRVMAALLKE